MNDLPNPHRAAGSAKGGTADGEEILQLDDRVYEDIIAQAAGARDPSEPQVLGALKEKIDAFLFQEARLLDSKRYRDWADLLTTDFIYWIPGSADVVDPRREGAIAFDDRRRIIDPITLIETNIQWAQVPRSRTCRTITNIEAFSAAEGILRVRSNVVIWEYRREHSQSYIGWQYHEILTATDSWRIRRKFIGLLDCDQPQGNTTFIL